MIKNILITGNLGYIGSVLSEELIKKKFNVVGFDIGYFKQCLVKRESKYKFKQIIKDIRKINKDDLINIDAIVHLAALSNDPLGDFNSKVTKDINFLATIKLAKLAKSIGVKRFIYLSSQSMYGISKKKEPIKENAPKKIAITAYAKYKWLAEKSLMKLCDKNFAVCALRPSTVFGPSPRFRSDIVFNNLTLNAFIHKIIDIKSDGKPWRPVIHIKDVSLAIIICLTAETKKIYKQAFNLGFKFGNFQVIEMAKIVQNEFKGCKIQVNKSNKSDERTYIVSFEKIFKTFKNFNPKYNLLKGAQELKLFYKQNIMNKKIVLKKTNRINILKELIKNKKIDKNFYKN
jgi:nucleoside-diphosphate-sugar epimerase